MSIGCSSGHVERMYAKSYPKSTFIGIDICSDAIDLAIKHKSEAGLDNADFFVYDANDLPTEWIGSFDGVIAVDVLHDLPQPCESVVLFRKLLKEDGFLSILDMPAHKRIADNIGSNMAAMLYTMSIYYCIPLALASGGTGAGAMWGRENILECLKQGGFGKVLEPQEEGTSHRGGLAYYVAWKGN